MSTAARNSGNGVDVSARMHSLKSDFEALQKDVGHLFGDIGAETSAQFANAGKAATGFANSTIHQAESIAEDSTATLRDAIKTQPFAAIALSMGAGALVGALLRR